MWHRLKRLAAHALVVTLAVPTSVFMGLPAIAHGAESDVRINEVLVVGTETVELFNAGADPVNISGWQIVDASGSAFHTVPNSTTIAAGGFYTATDNVSPVAELFADSGDTVALLTATGTGIDAVLYGDSLSAQLIAPGTAKTIGRVSNGSNFWYSGLTPTLGATNNNAVVPALPTTAAVKAGTSNVANVINSVSAPSVNVDVTLSSGSVATDTVSARLYDALNFKAGTAAGTAGAGTATVSGISTTTSPALTDGAITVRTFVTSAAGVATMFGGGTAATKDTVAPTPTVTSPAAASTVRGSSVGVQGAVEANASITVYPDVDNNGVRDSSTVVAGPTTSTAGTYGITVPLTANSANNFVLVATDQAGNGSVDTDIPTITEDSTAPAAPATVSVASDSTGKATVTFATSASPDVTSYKIYTDNGTGTVNFVTALTSLTHPTSSFTTDQLKNGTHQFVVRSLDGLGNESANTTATSVVVAGPRTEAIGDVGGTVDLVSSLGLSFTTSSSATGQTTYTVVNNGTTIPAGSAPSGVSFLGQYFTVTASNSTAFPVLVKYYYTSSQLSAAGITESQLQGIYFYDSASTSWKLYGSTGVDTADQTVGGIAFAGFVWANADHFTPLAFGADTAAPSIPVNTVVSPGDGQAKLTWDKVSDATGYWVRYRVATERDSAVSYTRLFVSGGSNTSATITGLTNGTLYEFGVAAQDAVGNVSDFAVVNGRPAAAGQSTALNPVVSTTTASSATAVTTAAVSTTAVVEERSVVSQPSTGARGEVEPSGEQVAPTDEGEGEVQGEQADEGEAGRTRLFVTLLILLIAAGAGAAGYYGYQWWSERPVATTAEPTKPVEPSPTPKPKKNGSKGGRW